MRRTHIPVVLAMSAGILLAATPLAVLAQSVEFTSGISGVPTLDAYGLIMLTLMVAGAAYWLTRKRGTASRLLTLAATVAGGAFLSTNPDVIGNAWATTIPTPVTAYQSPVILVDITYSGEIFEISNGGSSPITITALVDGGSCGTGGTFYYDVSPYYAVSEVPGCAPSLQVAPGMTCAVQAICSEAV